jgi:hypothetical protein
MSRLYRYQTSITNFIKDRSCLFTNINQGDNFKFNQTILYDSLVKSDMYLPILFLTIMNNQNKKKKITIQGYYLASCIEFLHILSDNNIFNNNALKVHLILSANKSLHQNIDILKNYVSNDDNIKISTELNDLYHSVVNLKKLLGDTKYKYTTNLVNNEVSKWYIKNKNADIIKNTYMIDKTSYEENLNNKLGSLIELVICGGWILGGGSLSGDTNINQIKKIATYFTRVYKIYLDFINIEVDLINLSTSNFTDNHIINYGIHESYELFMNNKQKFIEECLKKDMYTDTIKEIISNIEIKVDNIIDETSPDLKSNVSLNFIYH